MILDNYLTDLLRNVSRYLINILGEGEIIMAMGDRYDAQAYAWHLRELSDGRIFVRYDNEINFNNKGRYNTSPIVKVETNNVGQIRFTTQSGSQYIFRTDKCARPMNMLMLTARFGVEF